MCFFSGLFIFSTSIDISVELKLNLFKYGDDLILWSGVPNFCEGIFLARKGIFTFLSLRSFNYFPLKSFNYFPLTSFNYFPSAFDCGWKLNLSLGEKDVTLKTSWFDLRMLELDGNFSEGGVYWGFIFGSGMTFSSFSAFSVLSVFLFKKESIRLSFFSSSD